MEADLFSRRDFGSNEFFDDGKDISELLVVFLLKSFDLASEIAIRIHKPTQLHERAHNCDIASTARLERRTLESIATPCSVKA